MNRLYAIESTPTLTGAKADHRLALRAFEVEGFAVVRSPARSAPEGAARRPSSFSNANAAASGWARSLKDLQAHRGRARDRRGRRLSAGRRPSACAPDERGARDTSGRPSPTADVSRVATMDQIVASPCGISSQAMDAGQVDVLVILGSNPVFTAPADFQGQERLGKVGLFGCSTRSTRTRRRCAVTGICPRRMRSRAGATRARMTAPSAVDAAADRRQLYEGRRRRRRSSSGLHRSAARHVRSHDLVKGLLGVRAHAGAQGRRQLDDHRFGGAALQERRRQLLEARPARRVGDRA